MSIYDQDLEKNSANYVPLSPVSFIERAAICRCYFPCDFPMRTFQTSGPLSR